MTDSHARPVNIAAMARSLKQRHGARGPARTVVFSSSRGDAAILLPGLTSSRSPLSSTRARQALGPIFGPLALAIIVVATLGVVLVASAAPSNLVQGSYGVFPTWLAGPLHGLLSPVLQRPGGKAVLPWQT